MSRVGTDEGTVWLGIDVAKAMIDVAWGARGRLERVARIPEALQRWAQTVPATAVAVLESTGGYERAVAAVLRERGVAVCIVNPRQVRDFAKATGQLAKTDRLDARVLARFGDALRPRTTPIRAVDAEALRALVDRRRQLVEARTSEKNRRKTAPATVVGSIDDHIEWLDRQIERLDREIAAHVAARAALAAQVERLTTAPGVGPIVAVTLLTHLPELGTIDRKRIAALAGLAPFARDSGRARGHRVIWGGRGDVRAMLYVAAHSAARWSAPLRSFYERLVANGKPKKAALAAVARKLLVSVNAMLRDNVDWALQPSCC